MCCPAPTGPAPPVFFGFFSFCILFICQWNCIVHVKDGNLLLKIVLSFSKDMVLCSLSVWMILFIFQNLKSGWYASYWNACLFMMSHTSTRMFVFHEAIIRLVYLNTNTTPEKLQVLVTGSRQNISKYCVCCEINVVFAQKFMALLLAYWKLWRVKSNWSCLGSTALSSL